MMLPIAVISHPDREQKARNLAAQVDGELIWDTRVEQKLGTLLGCAATHLDALKKFASFDAEWLVVLEDDAVPVGNFRGHLVAALECAPSPVVGLYLGTGNPSGESQRQIRQAVVATQERNLGWITADCLIGSVGYAVEIRLLPDIIDFITDRDSEELPLRITRWSQERDVAVCYTMPSLVNHEDSPSIGTPWRGHAYSGRKAWWCGTRNRWDTGSIQLGHCPIWSKPRTDA